jgi:hypothetical protein
MSLKRLVQVLALSLLVARGVWAEDHDPLLCTHRLSELAPPFLTEVVGSPGWTEIQELFKDLVERWPVPESVVKRLQEKNRKISLDQITSLYFDSARLYAKRTRALIRFFPSMEDILLDTANSMTSLLDFEISHFEKSFKKRALEPAEALRVSVQLSRIFRGFYGELAALVFFNRRVLATSVYPGPENRIKFGRGQEPEGAESIRNPITVQIHRTIDQMEALGNEDPDYIRGLSKAHLHLFKPDWVSVAHLPALQERLLLTELDGVLSVNGNGERAWLEVKYRGAPVSHADLVKRRNYRAPSILASLMRRKEMLDLLGLGHQLVVFFPAGIEQEAKDFLESQPRRFTVFDGSAFFPLLPRMNTAQNPIH